MERYYNSPSSDASNTSPAFPSEWHRKLAIFFFWLTICACVIALIMGFGYIVKSMMQYQRDRIDSITSNFSNYLIEHECERTGFVGEQPQAIYKCNNGIYLERELIRISNPGLNV